MTDEELERILAKREQAARFRALDEAAFLSQLNPKKPPRRARAKKPKPAPKPGRAAMSSAGTCDTCGRAMRPWNKSVAEMPGTLKRAREGLCNSCANPRALPPEELKHFPRPDNCVSCERPMRGRGPAIPGTLRHVAHGLCSTCWRQQTEGRKPRVVATECVDCGAGLVPHGKTPGPGQKRHGGGGRCEGCKSAKRRSEAGR